MGDGKGLGWGDELVHLGHGFAPYAFSALPVGLTLGKVHSPSCQGPLLKDPGALAKAAFENVLVEVVYHLADVKRRRLVVGLDGHDLTVSPGAERLLTGKSL